LIAVWFVVTYLEDLPGFKLGVYLFLTRADYMLASILVGMFVLIFLNFPEEAKKKTTSIVIATITFIIALISISPLYVTGVQYDAVTSNLHFITSFFDIPYLVIISVLIGFGITSLYLKFRKSKGLRRSQIQYVLVGASLSTIVVLLVDGLIPRFIEVGPTVTRLGIYGGLFFVGFFSVAIIKHKLMDIRMVVARSVAYAILMLILAGFYTAVIIVAQSLIFPNANYSPGYITLQIALAIVMAISFQPLRRWVTKVSDKIFFKNSYNKDDLLSELSNTLGSTIVLIEMLYKVSDILTKEMKISRTLFALIKDTDKLYTVQANGYKETPDINPRDILHITKDGLMVADELEDNSAHKHLLRQYDATVAIPLKTEKEVVGVLLLGEKSSGDMYSQQDLSVLEIIAPEIAVAIENAKSYEEINRFNITLRQEVKRATYRLKEKNTQLMELDKAKDEFISMASHQLRTPLTAIKGYLSMLLEGDAGDIKVSQYDFINEAYSGANRMVGLINDLLNVSRMETGRFFLELKEVDIERVVEEEVKQLQNTAKAKGLYLKIERKGKVPHIWADETKIRQVVMNFMDNAIYYTNNGGVTVVLSHDRDNFIYEVKDTGIGVPKAQREHLFEKFFRADNARTARPDGTGLGIYLAKRVITDHGGEVIFDSVEGKGSTFGFKFPLKKKVETKPMSSPAPLPKTPTPTMTEAVNTAEKGTTENH
jgi:signal transduction histidine kinase